MVITRNKTKKYFIVVLLRFLSFCLQDEPHFDKAEVMSVVDKFVDEENLISDGSRPFCLPIVKGKHQDLNCITPQTVGVLYSSYR